MELDNKQLLNIVGGINITGAFLNYLVKGINSILDLGRSVGTAIRRITSKNICPF